MVRLFKLLNISYKKIYEEIKNIYFKKSQVDNIIYRSNHISSNLTKRIRKRNNARRYYRV